MYFNCSKYRDVNVIIGGAEHKPPAVADMKIHPFIDGNGRTSGLIMNYQLMSNGFLPVSISKDNRFEYYNFLEEYAINDNLEPFVDLIAELEEKQLNIYNALI